MKNANALRQRQPISEATTPVINGNRIFRIRPSDIIKASPVINSLFLKQSITGWDRMMAWYTNNAKRVMDTKGNVTYGKIEPKLRKTDGFMAWVHSICCLDFLPEEVELPAVNMGVFTY